MAVNGGAKLLVGILGSALVTIFAAWLVIGSSVASDADLEKTEKVIGAQMATMSKNCSKKHDQSDGRLHDLEEEEAQNDVEHQKLTDAVEAVAVQLAHQNEDMEELKKGQRRMIKAVNEAVASRVLAP